MQINIVGGLMSGGRMSGGRLSGGLMSGGRMSGGRLSGGLMSGGLMSAHRSWKTVSSFIAHHASQYTGSAQSNVDKSD